MKRATLILVLFLGATLQGTEQKITKLDLKDFYKIHPLWWNTATLHSEKIALNTSLFQAIDTFYTLSYENNDHDAKTEKYYNNVLAHNQKLPKTDNQEELRKKILSTIFITEQFKEHLKKASYLSLKQLRFIILNKVIDEGKDDLNKLAYEKLPTMIKLSFTDEECKRICCSRIKKTIF